MNYYHKALHLGSCISPRSISDYYFTFLMKPIYVMLKQTPSFFKQSTVNGPLQIRLRIVNIFQNRQKIKSSGMRNLTIGRFVTVRKLRNAKLIWPVRKIPNCVYGGIHFINLIFLGCCVFFSFFVLT